MEACPVVSIHKVTEGGEPAVASGAKCPVTGKVSQPQPRTEGDDLNIDDITDTPSMQEFKKLRRVMAMITNFYRAGSDKKYDNYGIMMEEIQKLQHDQDMVEAQLEALNSNTAFKQHPKLVEYKKDLNAEHEAREKQRKELEEKKQEYHDLWQWSKNIVRICEWLEANLDDYCKQHLDLPAHVAEKIKPAPELTDEDKKMFAKGLAEITYNLKESQDFFEASVDGRLNKYHMIEKRIIEAQLQSLKKFNDLSPRRMHIEAELTKDLEYVEGLMAENPEARARKEKMLKNHREFFQVLNYQKEKLNVLGIKGYEDEMHFDPKYDHYKDEN